MIKKFQVHIKYIFLLKKKSWIAIHVHVATILIGEFLYLNLVSVFKLKVLLFFFLKTTSCTWPFQVIFHSHLTLHKPRKIVKILWQIGQQLSACDWFKVPQGLVTHMALHRIFLYASVSPPLPPHPKIDLSSLLPEIKLVQRCQLSMKMDISILQCTIKTIFLTFILIVQICYGLVIFIVSHKTHNIRYTWTKMALGKGKCFSFMFRRKKCKFVVKNKLIGLLIFVLS